MKKSSSFLLLCVALGTHALCFAGVQHAGILIIYIWPVIKVLSQFLILYTIAKMAHKESPAAQALGQTGVSLAFFFPLIILFPLTFFIGLGGYGFYLLPVLIILKDAIIEYFMRIKKFTLYIFVWPIVWNVIAAAASYFILFSLMSYALRQQGVRRAAYRQIYEHIEKNDLEALKQDIANKEMFNEALRSAIRLNNEDALKMLIAISPEFKPPSYDGMTPLMDSAQHGNILAMQLFLDAGADINAQAKEDYPGYNQTALAYALRGGHPDAALFLIKAGALVNKSLQSKYDETKEFYTESIPFLIYALYREFPLSLIQAMIAAGADVNAKATSGDKIVWTPLSMAKYRKNDQAVQALIKAGAKE